MDLGIKGKTAVVAASSRGIGRAVAAALADEGVNVALFARNPGPLEDARREMESRGVRCYAETVDLTRPEEIYGFVENVRRHLGPVDILVTNAGGPPPGGFERLTDDDWKKAVELNLNSVVHLIRAVLPDMKKNRWGRIVNLTSVSVKEPIDNLLLSNTIRPGVVGLSKTLSRELGEYGITVNCVAPGYTATERLGELAEARGKREGK
ncbi:MAG: SDR family NAD(P)-dependent oxidoreductase, partial [Thermoplasmata archaeon]|nr:SDR family NAD(P)-dependent oxidoreductase [Thermoplasmata archaeon]